MSDETGFRFNYRNKRMSLITIYGPNDDFYEGLSDIIRELQNQDIILVGDLDPEKTISITCISTIPRQEIKY